MKRRRKEEDNKEKRKDRTKQIERRRIWWWCDEAKKKEKSREVMTFFVCQLCIRCSCRIPPTFTSNNYIGEMVCVVYYIYMYNLHPTILHTSMCVKSLCFFFLVREHLNSYTHLLTSATIKMSRYSRYTVFCRCHVHLPLELNLNKKKTKPNKSRGILNANFVTQKKRM